MFSENDTKIKNNHNWTNRTPCSISSKYLKKNQSMMLISMALINRVEF